MFSAAVDPIVHLFALFVPLGGLPVPSLQFLLSNASAPRHRGSCDFDLLFLHYQSFLFCSGRSDFFFSFFFLLRGNELRKDLFSLIPSFLLKKLFFPPQNESFLFLLC